MRLKQTQEQEFAPAVDETERRGAPARGRDASGDSRRLPARPLSLEEQIQVDRLFLEEDPADPGGLERFKASIQHGGARWLRDTPRGHTGMDEWGVREKRTTESMQIGIGPHGAVRPRDPVIFVHGCPPGPPTVSPGRA